jgi:PPOX class probable F420-dependent enzyme
MSDQEFRAFASAGRRTGKLATVGPDGTPMVTPVWFVLDGDDFVFTTGGKTAKARNLRRNPRAALCVSDDEPPYAYAEVRGDVTLGEDPDELVQVATAAAARYMGPDQAEEYGKRNGVPGELVVRLRPDKVIAYSGIAE